MKRRHLISVIPTLAVGTLAGCSGNESAGDPTPTADESPSPAATADTPNEQALSHYDAAVETLVETKSTLDEWAETSYESSEVETLQASVRSARADLDAAESAAEPSGDLIQQIATVRTVADFQELCLAYYEGVTTAFQVISDAGSFSEAEQHQRAAETYGEAQGVIEDIRGVLDDMETVYATLDNEALAADDLAYSGEPLDHIDLENRQAIDGANQYLVGFENVHLAFVQLETGQEHYESEAFGDARDAWESGLERARAAQSAFENVVDNPHTPQNFREQSIQTVGFVDTVIEAYETLLEGAEEAEAGNHEAANNLVRDGFETLGEL